MTRWGANVPIAEVILEDRLLQVGLWSRLSLVKCTMHWILSQKGSEVLKINSISQPHLVLRENSRVITGDCWSHGSQVHFGVLVTSAASANGLIFGSGARKKDTKSQFHISSALVFSCLLGCRTTAASPESHEVWIHWKFQPRHNLCLQPLAACSVCTSEHSLLHGYIIAMSTVFCTERTQS